MESINESNICLAIFQHFYVMKYRERVLFASLMFSSFLLRKTTIEIVSMINKSANNCQQKMKVYYIEEVVNTKWSWGNLKSKTMALQKKTKKKQKEKESSNLKTNAFTLVIPVPVSRFGFISRLKWFFQQNTFMF